MKKKTVAQEPVRFGIVSLVNFGSVGYRRALVELAWEIFEKEKVSFIVCAAGLIDQKALIDPLPKKEEEQKEYIENLAREIAEVIPRIYKNGNGNGNEVNGSEKEFHDGRELVRTYIVTSKPFDGWVGALVARELPKLRNDIRYQGQGHATMRIKQIGKLLRVLVPEKKPWRSQYYGTPAQNLVLDDSRRSTSPVPDLYVCAGFASSIQKPAGGEFARPFITVPGLHKLEQVNTSENQIGVKIVEFSSDDGIRVRTYNFKNFVAKEREFINIPASSSKVQEGIIQALKTSGPLTAGLLEESLKISRDQIRQEIENLKRFRAGIVFDESSERYDFSQDWFREKIRYHWPKDEEFKEDTIVGFGCLHAGSRYCDYEYFVMEVPELILRWKAKILVGAGDFIEGSKHDLIIRGEVYGGANNTNQERLAASVVGRVIVKVFKKRFLDLLKSIQKGEHISQEKLREIVNEALITFVYRKGNHDEWQQNIGFTPLSEFRNELAKFVTNEIDSILEKYDLALGRLYATVENKLIDIVWKEFPLSSGVSLEAFHPYNARMAAVTGRGQQLMPVSKAAVIFAANWHERVCFEHWEQARCQRVYVQLPTIKTMTDFEKSKGKETDFGVGVLHIKVYEGKILMSETVFHGKPRMKKPYSNEDIIQNLLKKLDEDRLVS